MNKLAIALGVAAILVLVGCAKKEAGGEDATGTPGGAATQTETKASGYLGSYKAEMPQEAIDAMDKAKKAYEETKTKADGGDKVSQAALAGMEAGMKQAENAMTQLPVLTLLEGGKFEMDSMGTKLTGDYKKDGNVITFQPPKGPDGKAMGDGVLTGTVDEAAGTITMGEGMARMVFRRN